MNPWFEVYGELALHGDFDPDAITRELGIEPTRAHRRGDLLFGGRTAPSGLWVWETESRINADSDDLAREVLDRIELTAETFRALKERHSISASLEIVPTMHVLLDDEDGEPGILATTPAHWFSVETLTRVAAYGLELDIDEYVHLADPSPDRLAAIHTNPNIIIGDPDELASLDWSDEWDAGRGMLP
ncbi:MAG: DUF4279 domain-containing protein [Micropruina sp.]|uniref:DUF4279 domain-containing protein n=1 Tax=Micropruina sp. TaxID=2737536 RepID=UPI0039E6CA25